MHYIQSLVLHHKWEGLVGLKVLTFFADLYSDYDLFKRLTKIENDYPGANIILHKYGMLPPVSNTYAIIHAYLKNFLAALVLLSYS